MNGDNTDSEKLNKIIAEIHALQEVVARFRQLRVDATEFACLKCIVTFKAVPTQSGSELRNFRNASAIAALQDEAQLTLNSYIHTSIVGAVPIQVSREYSITLPDMCLVDDGQALESQELFVQHLIKCLLEVQIYYIYRFPIIHFICSIFKELYLLFVMRFATGHMGNCAYPAQPCRFGKLLLLLPALRSVNPSTIEEVFFKKTIGNVPITRLLSDIRGDSSRDKPKPQPKLEFRPAAPSPDGRPLENVRSVTDSFRSAFLYFLE
eukprot:g43589.t1